MRKFAIVDVESGRRYPVEGRVAVGRAAHNDVVLHDRMVSNLHAEIVHTPDDTLQVRDLASRHGVFVGNQRTPTARLEDGDEILIGPVRLRVELVEQAADTDEVRKLRAMFELSRAIGVEHDLDRILERIVQTCFQLLPADRAMIVTYLPGSKTPCATLSRARDGATTNETLSTSVLSQVMATREPFIRTGIASDTALQRSQSLAVHGVRSIVAVPLLFETSAEWLGVIHLDSSAEKVIFAAKHLDLLAAIASQAALAIKNAMLVRQMQAVVNTEWKRLERVVAKLPVGVVVVDEGRCVLANDWIKQSQNVLGEIRAGEAIDAVATIPLERLVMSRRREQVRVGSPERTLVVDAQTNDDGRDTVVVITDVTAEHAQQAKAAHQDRLALVGQLAGGIAHDFNNLLFVIQSYAGALEESGHSPEVSEDAQMIQQAARSAAALVRQLLQFSRQEEVRPSAVDLVAHLQQQERLLAEAVGTGVQIDFQYPATRPHVLLDPTQLDQVLMNLAVNARDAMDGKGELRIEVKPTSQHVMVRVSDTGSGMPPEVAARIFEPYFSTKARTKGSGLGLATVHGIIQHAKGTIEIQTAVGHGTTFVLTFPMTDLGNEIDHASAPPSKGCVLVVDDDERMVRVTHRMLNAAGYHVIVASSGDEALAKLHERTVDVVLSDVVMPGMSGRDLARVLEDAFPSLPVVFMSGYAGTLRERFISKPFDRPTLLAALEASLSSS